MNSLLIPSYGQGFCPRDGEPLNPHLWQGLQLCLAGSLGVTGATWRNQSLRGASLDGTLTGATWMHGANGPGVLFDANNEIVRTAALPWDVSQATPFTVVCRASVLGAFGTGVGTLLNNGGAALRAPMWLCIETSGPSLWLWKKHRATLPASWNDGFIHQFVGVHPAGAALGGGQMYFDGLPLSTDAAGGGGDWSTADTTVGIGATSDAVPSHEWNGEIEFVAVWDRALTAAEVQALAADVHAMTRLRLPAPASIPETSVIRAPARRIPSQARSMLFDAGSPRGKWSHQLRGKYRVFGAAEYRFYRSNTGPPDEGDTPFATHATLPHEPADAFADGTWYLSVSYFNGVIDSGFLPLGPAGETYLRLDLSGGAETGSPPAAPQDWRIEQRAATGATLAQLSLPQFGAMTLAEFGALAIQGVAARVLAFYYQSDATLRAEQWAIAYTTNGSDPPADTPDVTVEMPAGGLAVLSYDLPPVADGTTVKVRLQTRRQDGSWVYSENSTIQTITADASGPTAPADAEVVNEE